ncbi:MAG TPA: P-loop NTPase fold protein [Burkholderiales bacterium]|nr:P-loop NTPase fold protein [Burkholderiales bacterium]
MKLKRPPIEISKDEPFKNDQLGRLAHAKILSEFVRSLDEPFVLALESGWGHGKSTFIRMWAQSLQNDGHVCVYFNAWDADFSGDPLIPLLSEVTGTLATSGFTSPEISAYIEKLKSIGMQVAKRSLPVAAKILTAGVLDLDAFTEKSYAEAIEGMLKEKFGEYEASKQSVEQFRNALENLVERTKSEGKKIPLVFFVDELDRCKPPFAVAVLERLKHMFNVPNVAYVLAIDRRQLEESIKGVYGQGCDASRYLRRFVDMAYHLPEPQPDQYVRYLLASTGLDQALANTTQDAYADKHFIEVFALLSRFFGLRLRDQEQAILLLSVAWRTLKKGDQVNQFVVALLVVVKLAEPETYLKLKTGLINAPEFIKRLESNPEISKYFRTNYGHGFWAYIVAYFGEEGDINALVADLSNAAKQPSASEETKERSFRMLRILRGGSRQDWMRKLASRLDIAESFSTPAPQ